MTPDQILKAFDVERPRPDQQAMAEYLSDCEQAVQALSEAPEPGKEKRKRLALAVLEQVEEATEQHIPMDSTPDDLLLEAKWRIGDNV